MSGTTATSAETANTADYIARHALERPNAVALIERGQAITYAKFNRDIGRFTAALRDFGLPPGSAVAVVCDNIYTHWLLLLAFEHLNVATASSAKVVAAIPGVDLLLSDLLPDRAVANRQFLITPGWVQQTLARESTDGVARAKQSPGDIVRIVSTSGTTGRSKRIAFTRRMYELRTLRYGERYRFTQTSRYHLTLLFSIGLPYGCATACLRAGGCVVAEPFDTFDIIAKYGITHLTLVPHLLKMILDGLPADFIKPADLIVGTSGSALSDELAERALKSLATEVFDNYGSNEIGSIRFRRASLRESFAPVCAGVEVEVVDEDGRPLPHGESGQLRIKSESMVEGYLDDPEATRQFFRNGWFYSNDVGVLDGLGRLKIEGRTGETITTVGGKYEPSHLEALVAERLGEGDVGICMLGDAQGNECLHVAVAGARLGDQELLTRVTQAFDHVVVGKFLVARIKAIPRNAAGKIQRDQLKASIAQASKRA